MERRHHLHLRAADGGTLQGYAAVFNETANLGYATESIAPGAFVVSLLRNDILALADHDQTKLLGRTRSQTLHLTEDSYGLRFELSLPDTSVGRDLLQLVSRGDIGGASIGFLIEKESWDGNHRRIDQADLREISIVSSWPAYAGTSVTKARGMSLALAKRWLETV